MNRQQPPQPACVDDPRNGRIAADQSEVYAAMPAALRLLGQRGECAATHEVQAAGVDDERAGRAGRGGRHAQQAPPGRLVGSGPHAAGKNKHRPAAALGSGPQCVARIGQLGNQMAAQHQMAREYLRGGKSHVELLIARRSCPAKDARPTCLKTDVTDSDLKFITENHPKSPSSSG